MRTLLEFGGNQSVLHPAGPQASALASLSTWYILGGLAVWLAVMATVVAALTRAKQNRFLSDAEATRTVLYAGGIVPGILLLALLVHSVLAGREVSAGASEVPASLSIRVEGHQWWWDVFYLRGEQIVARTANEIHIPVGREIPLALESRDVIHSFWIPALAGKVDLIPGRHNDMHLHADREGVFRGQCAEYCGVQHAHMGMELVAESDALFERWLIAQAMDAEPSREEAAQRGAQVFQDRSCVLCHSIRGTGAAASVGPDLTHVASRRSLAAATLRNDRGTLAGWIADAQGVKPGCHMPRITLSPQELQDVVSYLESLR